MSGTPTAKVVVPESSVNLSRSPIVCAIYTERPLPAEAWQHVWALARTIERTAQVLSRIIEEREANET